jgi:hypothetical protein
MPTPTSCTTPTTHTQTAISWRKGTCTHKKEQKEQQVSLTYAPRRTVEHINHPSLPDSTTHPRTSVKERGVNAPTRGSTYRGPVAAAEEASFSWAHTCKPRVQVHTHTHTQTHTRTSSRKTYMLTTRNARKHLFNDKTRKQPTTTSSPPQAAHPKQPTTSSTDTRTHAHIHTRTHTHRGGEGPGPGAGDRVEGAVGVRGQRQLLHQVAGETGEGGPGAVAGLAVRILGGGGSLRR